METSKQFIKKFKTANPIHYCPGCDHGRWKWRRYLNDGIDLRYGHNTLRAAQLDRAKVARFAHAIAQIEALMKWEKQGPWR